MFHQILYKKAATCGLQSHSATGATAGVTSGFRLQLYEICALLGYYAAYSGNYLPTFRDNQSIPSSGVKNYIYIFSWPLKNGPNRLSRNVDEFATTRRVLFTEECRSRHKCLIGSNVVTCALLQLRVQGRENEFDVCVTVHHWYNTINSRLDATITNFTDNYNQLNMFRVFISPILRSTRLWYKAPTMLPGGSTAGALYHKL